MAAVSSFWMLSRCPWLLSRSIQIVPLRRLSWIVVCGCSTLANRIFWARPRKCWAACASSIARTCWSAILHLSSWKGGQGRISMSDSLWILWIRSVRSWMWNSGESQRSRIARCKSFWRFFACPCMAVLSSSSRWRHSLFMQLHHLHLSASKVTWERWDLYLWYLKEEPSETGLSR